jgi:S1-C subfamily serine protease
MKLRWKAAASVLSLLALASVAGLVAGAAADDLGDDSSLSAAICPLVYRLDESPSRRGYRYSFFGNAFFINEQGDLLTAAHVLETFRNGGQPSILLARPNRPSQLLPVTVLAADPQHDVAILRASPNPFAGHYRVGFLSIASEPPVPGQPVLAISLHPARLQNAKTFQAPVEDRSPGQVLSYETTQLEKSAPPAEVFLLSHPVTLGQSGSPVLDLHSRAVIGLVEGRWLRNSLVSLAQSNNQSVEPPGAAVPIRYAIALLDQNEIPWHVSRSSTADTAPSTSR